MQQKIKVLKSEKSDSIILTSKNPEFSSILIGCDTFGIAPTGFATIDKRRAFYTGRTEVIEHIRDLGIQTLLARHMMGRFHH